MDVLLSFRKIISGVLCHSLKTALTRADSGRFIPEFSFSRIRKSTTVTHLPLELEILLPLAITPDVRIQRTLSGIH